CRGPLGGAGSGASRARRRGSRGSGRGGRPPRWAGDVPCRAGGASRGRAWARSISRAGWGAGARPCRTARAPAAKSAPPPPPPRPAAATASRPVITSLASNHRTRVLLRSPPPADWPTRERFYAPARVLGNRYRDRMRSQLSVRRDPLRDELNPVLPFRRLAG